LLTLIFTIVVFNSAAFQSVTGFTEYSLMLTQTKSLSYVNWLTYLLIAVDVICLLSDDQKRTLHDRIGNTFVIVQPS
jgi:uncharacterized RDD family membrane protein YckC